MNTKAAIAQGARTAPSDRTTRARAFTSGRGESPRGPANPENAEHIRACAMVDQDAADQETGQDEEQVHSASVQPEGAFKQPKRRAVGGGDS